MRAMHKRIMIGATAGLMAIGTAAWAAGTNNFHEANPNEFDPAHTYLVQGSWLSGLGCPTNASTWSGNGNKADGTYTDPACTTGDAKDKKNEGLILAKTGPTSNFAAAYAELKDVKGITLTEVGYDIRKPNSPSDLSGSHCGAGAPRFNITTDSASAFIGCNSPAPTVTDVGNGWLRLRWTAGLPAGAVKDMSVLFDEGQDASGGPDQFGLAVIDNIDINGTLVGRGPTDAG